MYIVKQCLSKHVPTPTNMHTTEELFEAMVWCVGGSMAVMRKIWSWVPQGQKPRMTADEGQQQIT
jgi:hypothetical protein